MTDKQIIIDGVDVHWCEHYTGNIGYLTDKNWTCRAKIQGTKCEDWSNCYFKRWQRKEQECDMWKNLTVDNGAVALKYQQQIDQLKAENDNIKETFDDLFKVQYKLADTNKKLRQCLTEIKEIAELGINDEYVELVDRIGKISIINDEVSTHDVCGLILKKISECEVV